MPADDRPVPRRASRRDLLVLAAGTAAATLAGCGSNPGRRITNAENRGADADVLYAVLGVAEQAVSVYQQAVRLLSGSEQALVRRIAVQEEAHVYALSGAIYRLGGNAAPATSSYPFTARSGAAALGLAAELEGMAIGVGVDALPKLTDLQARTTVVSVANCDAQHLLLIDRARGIAPFPSSILRGQT